MFNANVFVLGVSARGQQRSSMDANGLIDETADITINRPSRCGIKVGQYLMMLSRVL